MSLAPHSNVGSGEKSELESGPTETLGLPDSQENIWGLGVTSSVAIGSATFAVSFADFCADCL